MEYFGSSYVARAGFCECGEEILDFIKGGVLLFVVPIVFKGPIHSKGRHTLERAPYTLN